jgi:antitoxin YefM
METLTALEAQERFSQMIKDAVQDRQQFRVTSEEGVVVVLPEETYQNILVTLELLSTPGLLDQIKMHDFEDEYSKIEAFPQATNH